MPKDLNMNEKYFKIASDLMESSNLCADEEAANILKNGSLKIFELAKSQSSLIKTAQAKTGTEDAE